MKSTFQQEYFDVFVSYRRDGGSAIASLLKHKLLADPNLSVFLDTEEIKSGDWAERIESSLVRSSNFLFLLTPGSLKRCFADPANDVVLKEIKKACDLRSRCENSMEKGSADSQFRIIPVFLGEMVESLCEEHKNSHPDVVEIISSLIRHNGINLADASGVESELRRLGETMLLKRAGRFAGTLIEKSLFQKSDVRGSKVRENLEELFSCYLNMFDPSEYSRVRDALQPLVHGRLMSVLDSVNSEKFDEKLKSFRLGVLKSACAVHVNASAAHGSRSRVMRNTERWLRGEEVNPFPETKKCTEIVDRSLRVCTYFTEFIRKNTLVTRTRLIEVIRARTGPGGDFHFFSPDEWKKYQAIGEELFDRISYRQICLEFLRKNWLSLQKQPSNNKLTPTERSSRKVFMTELRI